MKRRSSVAPLVVCILAGACSSCTWFRKPRVKPPVEAPRIFKPPLPRQPEKLEKVVVPAPPPLVADAELAPPPVEAMVPDVRPYRPPHRPLPAKPEKAGPAEPPPAESAENTPQLGQILSPEQRREYQQEVRANLERARRSVAIVRKRNPTPEQQSAMARVETFISQAERAQQTDLILARSLAERAALLAEDLAAGTQ